MQGHTEWPQRILEKCRFKKCKKGAKRVFDPSCSIFVSSSGRKIGLQTKKAYPFQGTIVMKRDVSQDLLNKPGQENS